MNRDPSKAVAGQRSAQRVSIRDVARLAKVSIATVSRCLNDPGRVREHTRARVLAAIEETGYSPDTLAQNFRRGRTHVIMVVLPSIGDPFFTDVMRGIRSVAAARGYSLLINETQFNTLTADQIGTMVVSRQADGIVLLASLSPFGSEVLSATSHRALPTVIGCEVISPELSGYPSVHIDNRAAAAEATRYLVGRGHRRIAFVSGQSQSLLTRDREEGYRAEMAAAGLPVADGWVVEGQLTLDGSAEATRRLLALPRRPTAIFCANDEMAMGCMHAIRDAGLAIPADVSVIGFDDTRYAAVLDPPLTTIHQPATEIGERAMQRLLREIEQGRGDGADVEIVPHRLVVRKSVGPPPARG